MIEAQYQGDVICIARIENRPWMPIEPICQHLGIDVTGQTKRVRRHHDKNGLELRIIDESGVLHVCLPLEEVQWWFRTLRPSTPESRERLTLYRNGLVFHLFSQWVRSEGVFSTTRDHRDRMTQINPLPKRNPPQRKSGITKRIAEQIKTMRAATGLSYTKIGVKFGYSAATVCQIVNDRYPVALKDDE